MIAIVASALFGLFGVPMFADSCSAQSECAVLTVADVQSSADPDSGGVVCSTYFRLQPPPSYGPSSHLSLYVRSTEGHQPELLGVDSPADWDAVLSQHGVTWLGPHTTATTFGFAIHVRLPAAVGGFRVGWDFALSPVSGCGDTLSVQCGRTPVSGATWGRLKALFD